MTKPIFSFLALLLVFGLAGCSGGGSSTPASDADLGDQAIGGDDETGGDADQDDDQNPTAYGDAPVYDPGSIDPAVSNAIPWLPRNYTQMEPKEIWVKVEWMGTYAYQYHRFYEVGQNESPGDAETIAEEIGVVAWDGGSWAEDTESHSIIYHARIDNWVFAAEQLDGTFEWYAVAPVDRASGDTWTVHPSDSDAEQTWSVEEVSSQTAWRYCIVEAYADGQRLSVDTDIDLPNGRYRGISSFDDADGNSIYSSEFQECEMPDFATEPAPPQADFSSNS